MFYELYELTFSVANGTNTSVFVVFEQPAELVINIINHLIERGESSKPQATQKQQQQPQKDFWDYI